VSAVDNHGTDRARPPATPPWKGSRSRGPAARPGWRLDDQRRQFQRHPVHPRREPPGQASV